MSEGVVHPPDYNTVYPPSTALPHKLRPRVTSPHHLPPALGPGLPAPGPGDQTGGITTSPPSRHSAEELIVVYDDSPVKSKNAPPYRPPPPPAPSHKLYHYEPRAPPLQNKYQHSYRQALHSWAADQNINNNNNDDKKDERRGDQREAGHTGEGYTSQRRPAAVQGFVRQRILAHQAAGGAAGRGGGGMIRAASLSHLLVGPRIETAFVGEDAYTVYYGAARNNTR